MPLYLTASHSSRIRKPADRSSSSRRTTSSSSFSQYPRSKPSQQRGLNSFSHVDIHGRACIKDSSSDKLNDTGRTVSPATMSPVKGLVQAITHTQTTMFCELLERAAGMNSTRIAQVLNFRKRLPPIASLAHVRGLCSASTRTERDIAALIASGDVRKIQTCGRGNEISGLAEFLVRPQDVESLIRNSSIESLVADKLIDILRQNPRTLSVPVSLFSPSEISQVRAAGFFVSPSIVSKPNAGPAAMSAVAPPSISRQASSNAEATSGEANLDSAGGIGSTRSHSSQSNSTTNIPFKHSFLLSLPNIGAYIRLLDDARAHLLDLLGKTQYREAPLYLLQERWDGAVDSNDNKVVTAKRRRGKFAGVLPGKTKKWKQFYGLNFDWILEECLGAGLVELFETNSVGYGVRAL